MRKKVKYIVVLMAAATLAAAVTGWFYREPILTGWYSLSLAWDDSRLAEYSQSEDQAKIAALERYCTVFIEAFAFQDPETQRAWLVQFDDTVGTLPEGTEDALLRKMLDVASDAAIQEHVKARAGSPESPTTRGYSRLIERINHFRSIEVAEEDDTPSEVLDAQWRDDEDFLVVGLFLLANASLQAKAADSLAAIGSKRCLQALCRQFFAACSAELAGAESEYANRLLRFALVNALAEIAGMNLSTYDGTAIEGYRILHRLATST